MAQDDAELVRRWQRGDSAAFEDLVRRWEGPIGQFLGRLVGETELAQDLSQEVFLRVYQASPRYRENGAFRSWLYQIALNAARDEARRSGKRPQSLEGCEPESPAAPADELSQCREMADSVARAVAELPERLREVLVLRHYEEMSFEGISRLLRIPASTLKSRFARALSQLRESLRHIDVLREENEL